MRARPRHTPPAPAFVLCSCLRRPKLTPDGAPLPGASSPEARDPERAPGFPDGGSLAIRPRIHASEPPPSRLRLGLPRFRIVSLWPFFSRQHSHHEESVMG